MKWISVKDKLPPRLCRVLIFVPEEDLLIYTALFNPDEPKEKKRFSEDTGWGFAGFYGSVTHWMPLPRYPGEEDED